MRPADPALSAPDAPPLPAPVDAARARIEAQIAVLTRLTEIGMEMAEACGRQVAEPQARPVFSHDPGLVFVRVARAVRMTIALQSRLAKDLADLDRAEDMAMRARKDGRRMRLRVLLGQAVSAGIGADDDRDEDAIEDEIESVASEAYERLTDAEDAELSAASFEAVLAAVCADLSLSPHWTARLHAAVATPGGPLAARAPQPHPPPQAISDRPWPPPLAAGLRTVPDH